MYTYVPLLFPVLWWMNSNNPSHAIRAGKNPLMTEDEIRAIMLKAQINNLAIRPVISSVQVGELRRTIAEYVPLALRLHPGIVKTKNLHQMTHIPQDIELGGPVYCQWSFKMERLNKKLGDVNNNGKPGERERTALKSRYRSTQIGLMYLQLNDVANSPSEKTFARDIHQLLQDSLPQDFKLESRSSSVVESIVRDTEDLEGASDQERLSVRFPSEGNLSSSELYMVKAALKSSRSGRLLRVCIFDESIGTGSRGSGMFRIFPTATRYKEIRFRHKRFRSFVEYKDIASRALADLKDCLFAIKPERDVLLCRRTVDIKLCAVISVFAHRLTTPSGTLGQERLFMLSSELTARDCQDCLGYRQW